MISFQKLQVKAFLIAALVIGLWSIPSRSNSYDSQVYQNLRYSRDALLGQQAELQRAYDDVKEQIDHLNAKMDRIDSYLRQVNLALKDVEYAIQTSH